MSEGNGFILKILQNLDKESMEKFLFLLNTKKIDGITIPKAQLEDANAVKVTTLLISYYPQPLESLRDLLLEIPSRQLAKEVSTVINTAKKKRENQTEETDGIPAKKAKYSEVPPYTGEYRLSDMEDYATKNQDPLIEKLKEYMEPSAFKTLEEELATRKLKNVFSLKATQFYSLVGNQKLKGFFLKDLKNPSHEIPSKILDVFFLHQTKQMNQPREKKAITSSPNSTGEQKLSNEREELPTDKVKENAQTSKEDILIKNDPFYAAEQEPEVKKKEPLLKNEKNNEISKEDFLTCDRKVYYDEEEEGDERKELPENEQKGDAQTAKQDTVIEEVDTNCDEKGEGDKRKELPENEQKEDAQLSKQDTVIEERDANCNGEGEGDERKELPENEQKGNPQISRENTFTGKPDFYYNGEDEKKEKRRNFVPKMKPVRESKNNKKNEKEVSENDPYKNLARAIRKHYEGKKHCIKIHSNCEHKKYKCLIAQDVILFKLEEETEYRILQNLQDAKDLCKNGSLKKNVEFELQFNMAVLGVQQSECISINNLKREKAKSFRKYEEEFEDIMSVIVLPVLALYNRVKLNTFFKGSLQ